mmetsp:Transcript_36374/g.60762  ORF Transcript_36374/g.60762 Transcript_36374/m.60762 type:complete len:245 (-) Transcript_36374:64-798(-)
MVRKRYAVTWSQNNAGSLLPVPPQAPVHFGENRGNSSYIGYGLVAMGAVTRTSLQQRSKKIEQCVCTWWGHVAWCADLLLRRYEEYSLKWCYSRNRVSPRHLPVDPSCCFQESMSRQCVCIINMFTMPWEFCWWGLSSVPFVGIVPSHMHLPPKRSPPFAVLFAVCLLLRHQFWQPPPNPISLLSFSLRMQTPFLITRWSKCLKGLGTKKYEPNNQTIRQNVRGTTLSVGCAFALMAFNGLPVQ